MINHLKIKICVPENLPHVESIVVRISVQVLEKIGHYTTLISLCLDVYVSTLEAILSLHLQ